MTLCIADNLRLLRSRAGYTLEGLAEIISVSRQTVAKWESGESMPDLQNTVRLATLFRVSLDELVTMPMQKVLGDAAGPVEDGHIMGTLDIGQQGEVHLPKSVLDLFGMAYGEKLLLLADQNQGIALVKCAQLDQEA